ncbi:MAG: hypothetical protein EOM38_10105 [Bacilli bacterium]|nr:hypothetical protein [Bacilli bacterium]
MQYRMIVDTNHCVGCHACEVACKQEFGAPLGLFRTMTLYMDSGYFPKVKREFLPIMCTQCEDARCQKACKKDAIYEEHGIVKIDEKKCDGCGDCVSACSLGAIYVNPLSHLAEKCNLCAHRLEIGQKAACEATCVSEAIRIIDLSKEALVSHSVGFKMKKNDKPRTQHIGANPLMKEKLQSGKPFSPYNYEISNWARRGV